MRIVWGSADRPLAVLLPGSGSTGAFVARAFGPALASLGIGLVSGDPARGADDEALLAALNDAAGEYRPVLVGGVSRGAHLAARWAAAGPRHRPDGLLLAMPAWTGEPGLVAAASGAAADEVDRLGVHGALAAIRDRAGTSPDSAWVLEELTEAWPQDENLAATLRATAASPGPTGTELGAIDVPCGVLALRDDPLHPAGVAREWLAALPRAALVETDLRTVGTDRTVLGRGALLAWLRARAASANRSR